LHHAIVVFCTDRRVPVRWKTYYGFLGMLMVFIQTFAATALVCMAGVATCAGSWEMCDDGQYCMDVTSMGWQPTCAPCGPNLPSVIGTEVAQHHGSLVAQQTYEAMVAGGMGPWYLGRIASENGSGVRARLPAFCQEGVGLLAEDCNSCFDGKVYTTRSDVLYGRMALSSVFDWCMLLLCTYLVSSSVNKEMVEIRAAYVILRSRLEAPKADARGSGKYLGDSTRVHNPKKEAGVHWLWRVLLFEIGLLRQCCVLPLVIATVPMFCLGMGMDALNVALNSLAVLFILEVDNSMFPMVLTASQQEYLATIEVAQVSVTWHPHSKRNTAMDVGATFVAVFAPLLLNHLVMRGGNFFMPPLMEICFGPRLQSNPPDLGPMCDPHHMLTSPGPYVTLMPTSPEPHMQSLPRREHGLLDGADAPVHARGDCDRYTLPWEGPPRPSGVVCAPGACALLGHLWDCLLGTDQGSCHVIETARSAARLGRGV